MRWRHLRFDDRGRFVGFAADENEARLIGFKRATPLVAAAWADVAEDVALWRTMTPSTDPDAHFLVRVGRAGRVLHKFERDPNTGKHRRGNQVQPHTDNSIRDLWSSFKSDHGITSDLTPRRLRHWVKDKGRKRLDVAELAYYQGHDPMSLEPNGMAGWYGTNHKPEEILERQAAAWSGGSLANSLAWP